MTPRVFIQLIPRGSESWSKEPQLWGVYTDEGIIACVRSNQHACLIGWWYGWGRKLALTQDT